jgi:hypothetical protein
MRPMSTLRLRAMRTVRGRGGGVVAILCAVFGLTVSVLAATDGRFADTVLFAIVAATMAYLAVDKFRGPR